MGLCAGFARSVGWNHVLLRDMAKDTNRAKKMKSMGRSSLPPSAVMPASRDAAGSMEVHSVCSRGFYWNEDTAWNSPVFKAWTDAVN